MSVSMLKSLRTDTRVSGRPGAGSDFTRVSIEFIGPPRSPAGGKERHFHTRIPGARKKPALASGHARRRHPLSIPAPCSTGRPRRRCGLPDPRSANRCLRPESRSDELVGAQVIVGLDDLAQYVFRRTIAAICVRMMPLDQVLVPRLDLRLGGVAIKVESHQSLDR